MRHPLARALVRAAAQRLAPWPVIAAEVHKTAPALSARPPEDAEPLLRGLLTLLSWSRRRAGSRTMPLVSVQVQLWVREARRLLREVADTPRFRWLDDGPAPEGTAALPMVYCRECGHAGWVTVADGFGDRVSLDYQEIARAVEQREPEVKYLHQDASVRAEDGSTPPGFAFDPRTGELHPAKELREGRVAVHAQQDAAGKSGRGRQRCPACGADEAMRFLASRSASLTSVAVGHLFTTPLNTDKKLLAFSDSVQDASHRAGFFGGRTYRFSLRSALLAVVPGEGGLPLAAIGPAMRAHWPARLAAGRWDPDTAFVGAFLPQDLEFLELSVDWEAALADHQARKREAETRGETFGETMPGPSPALVGAVAERLRWEATRELGVAARIGRTLEQSGCLAVTVDAARFERAVDRAAATLPEKLGALHGVGRAAFAQLVAGLVTRVRVRGGVLDPFLEKYVASGGSGFMLSKQQAPLLSPFGRLTTRPIFLCSDPRPRRFDSAQPAERRTWMTDWIGRALGLDLGVGEARDVGAALMPILVEAGLFGQRPMGGKHCAWGLLPEALVVTRAHAWRRCAACGFEVAAVPGSVTDPSGGPCLRYRCEGRFEPAPEDASRTATYYRRYYERGALGRVWPREHTGLLPREEREDLEIEFKERPRPNSPNLLSCTPTLEMGIDIGDLSATLLCSVPPGPASYVQRVGRAGRETGNALILSFAASRPHDLYYFEDPLAVMAGAIHPPGCFLDAPEVLKRQALAFAFDRLARDGHKMPGRLREALSGAEARFPQAVLEAIAALRAELREGFLELFAKQLTGESRKRIEAFFVPGGDGLSPIESRLATEVAGARDRWDDLRRQIKRLDARIGLLQKDEAERKKLEDPERELMDLGFERRYAQAELKAFLDQDLWGFFCDRSLLPNFAFPEAGVKLDAFVRREGMKNGVAAAPEHREWVRPPAAAIAELAPFNTFYGSGRQVVVQNLDLRHGGAPAQWQLCAECHHMAEVAKMPDPPPSTCPSCGGSGWGEVGRRRWLAPMAHVRAFAEHRDALVGDEREDRERAYYETHNFYDAAGSTPSPVWVNRPRGFGFELLPRLTLRRINFGPRDPRATEAAVAGRLLPEVRFVVCTECGQVQQPSDTKGGWAPHWPTCAQRKQPKEKQNLRDMHLVRQLESEALRLVVPISEHEWSVRLPNLRAALRLGLRLHFGGDPDFLSVDSYDEPLPGGEGHRRYVVVLDLVPGGTGMLVDLAQGKGAKLRQVLERAREALLRCPCNRRGDEVKACHLCLYVYRERQSPDVPRGKHTRTSHASVLDREVAIAELDALLAGFEGLEQAESVGTLGQEQVLESELERRLVARLDGWARERREDAAFERLDVGRWRLRVGARRWLVRAQVDVDELQAEHACRPDLIFYPEEQEKDVLPVAVFADGAAYHVQPAETRSRIEDDLRKRQGLVRPGHFLTWSITWRDLNEFDTGTITDSVPPWLPDAESLTRVKALASRLGFESVIAVLDRDPLTGLLAHLRDPTKLRDLAAVTVFAIVHGRGRQVASAEATSHHHRTRTAERPFAPPASVTAGGDTVLATTVMGAANEAMLVVSVPREALGALQRQPEKATITLRLEDGAEQRQRPQFQTAWRQLLRAWNLLQALPGTVVTSLEQLGDEVAPVVQIYPVRGAATEMLAMAAEKVAAPPGALPREAEERIAEIGDEKARAVVRAVVRRGASVPELPYELRVARRGTIGDIEMGWAAQRVGAYLDHQGDTADRLRTEGWTLFPIERGLVEAALAQALGLGEG